MNSAVVFTSEQLTILNVLNAYYLNNTFNYGSTGSGASSVTLNTYSGIATFTDSVTAGGVGTFRINNSLVTSATKVRIDLNYPSSPSFGVLMLTGYQCATDTIDFYLYNADGVASGGDIVVTFQILN